jgi:FemAB-related protein (PEP-CTERM system-associated)
VTGTGGGPDKTILNSPRFLAPLGYDSVCAYLYPEGDPGFEELKARAALLNAELIGIPDGGLTDLSIVPKLLNLCRERNVTIWHGHDYKTDALGLLLRQRHKMKLVSTVHGWGVRSRKTPFYHAVDRASLRRYDRIVCVSEQLRRECQAAGVPLSRLCEIENAIDLASYRDLPSREEACSQLGIPNDRPVIGSVGRLSNEKAFDVLIRSVDQLIESGSDATLVIAGDGPERTRLESLIEETGRPDRFRLLGHVPDPRVVFAALDIFAISSRSEGLPNVLLESLACRVPVVATTVGGIPRVVSDEHDALLVSPGDVDGLTLAFARVLNNAALAEQLSTNGLATVESRYSFETRMRKMVAVYDELLARNPVPSPLGGEGARRAGEGEPRTTFGSPTLTSETPSSGLRPPSPPRGEGTGCGVAVQARPKALSTKTTTTPVQVELTAAPSAWTPYLESKGHAGFYQRAEWLRVLQTGLRHETVCLQARQGSELSGVLPLAFVKSKLFGKFLVSLPYLNSSGIVADSPDVARALVDRAVEFADELNVRYLELRHEAAVEHDKLELAVTDKVHMRLELPETTDELWDGLKSKLRSQIRKPLNNESLTVHWGGHELLGEFYAIFCRNMRDLGTPPFSRKLFGAILDEFPREAELCCVRLDGKAIASGLLVHGPGVTEVPSASSLREFNSTSANMLLYWSLLSRAIERGQSVFDFGRSSQGGGTYKFKAQWGAKESPAVWQHYVREGSATDMRPNSGKFDLMIRSWQKLPVWMTQVIGPSIVRGIP